MVLHEQSNTPETKFGLERVLSHPAFICALLAVVTLIVFWPAKHCDFIDFDDPGYFSSNPHVLGGLTQSNVIWAFTNTEMANWHPLTWLSLMLDANIFGKGPAGPHFTNIFLHAANAALLFLLLNRTTGWMWKSIIIAALFALHPLRVESVAWVSERKDVLSTFFGLLALLSYSRFVELAKAQKQQAHIFYLLTFAAFALSLMAKPMLVTLPFLLLLLDFWPFQRMAKHNLSGLILEKIPFFVLTIGISIITFLIQKQGGAVIGFTQFPLLERIENTFLSYTGYLGKTFWPFALANPYSPPTQFPLPLVIFSVALFIGISWIAINFANKFPSLFVGWFWYVGTLIPVIGLVQVGNQSMADRYTYFPSIGFFLVFVWGIAEAILRWPFLRSAIVCIILAVVVALCARTRNQIAYWQNDGQLFSHTFAVTKNNFVACIKLGSWMLKNGDTDTALNYYHLALTINPDDPSGLYNIGNAFFAIGNHDEAIRDYQHALQIAPDQPDVLNNLGFAFTIKKEYTNAIACFEKSLKLNPQSADVHNNLGAVLFISHHLDEAAQHYREAIHLAPDNPQFYVNLGDVLEKQEKHDEAVQNYVKAWQLNPSNERLRAKLESFGMQLSN